MRPFTIKSVIKAVLAVLSISDIAQATRQYNKRNDLIEVPPLSLSGYTVPLEGGFICVAADDCKMIAELASPWLTHLLGTDTLPAPASNKQLQVLALGRGVMTYSCIDVDPTDQPRYISQNTELWDAAPLISYLQDEEALHELIPQLYAYNYAALQNSSLVCIGYINTQYGESVITLGDFGTFAVRPNATVPSPTGDGFSGYWVQSTSVDGSWDVYRVETAGDLVPADCAGFNSTFEIGYAAEYWFFHV